MSNDHVFLVPCKHNGSPTGKDCSACDGSGYVKVVIGFDGKPKECQHASNDGELEDCGACLGSGWAGMPE